MKDFESKREEKKERKKKKYTKIMIYVEYIN